MGALLVLSDAEHYVSVGVHDPGSLKIVPLTQKTFATVPTFGPGLLGVRTACDVSKECYLVDPASSHMLVSKIKPCM
ncbi:hypothetical protein TorRG33x02_173730, partial [Trema orientale]